MSPADKASGPETLANVANLLGIVHSSWMSQVTCVAAELGIADQLAGGPKTIAELAAATACHAPSLRRLLRALVTLGLCRERGDGLFEVTELGAPLRAGAPNSVRSWTIWWGRHLGPVWAQLLHSVRTGESARTLVAGTTGFEHLEQNPELADLFNDAMVELTRLVGREVIGAYDFSGLTRLVDVGGGFGELLAAILQAYPGIRGVLFDLAHTIPGARQHLRTLGVEERCEFVTGDFFEAIPAGADAYLLKSILHDWDDDRSAVILRRCHRAMAPGARLLLVERLMPVRLEASALRRAMARADRRSPAECPGDLRSGIVRGRETGAQHRRPARGLRLRAGRWRCRRRWRRSPGPSRR